MCLYRKKREQRKAEEDAREKVISQFKEDREARKSKALALQQREEESKKGKNDGKK